MRPRVLVLPLLFLATVRPALTQESVKTAWERWYSPTLGVSFMAHGTPSPERVVFRGALGQIVEGTMAVAFDFGKAEFSVVRLVPKADERLDLVDVSKKWLEPYAKNAQDLVERDRKESLDCNVPFIDLTLSFTGPDDVPDKVRVLFVRHGDGVWLFIARHLSEEGAALAAKHFVESVWMDADGKVKPGDKEGS